MRRRGFLVGGLVVLVAWVAAGVVTAPDVDRGIWVDYLVPPLVVVAALVAVRRDAALPWLGTLARLVVGGVWIWAGVLKLPDPASSIAAVQAYELLPQGMVEPVGYLLPVLEVVLGLALVAGLMTRGAALISIALLLAFVIGIASAWARGLNIDCGCFGGGGATVDATLKYPWELSRDVALIGLSLALLLVRRTRLALDTVLFGGRATLDDFLDDFLDDSEDDESDDEDDVSTTAPEGTTA